MAENKKTAPTEKIDKQVPNNVISITSARCVAQDCKSKPSKAGFCDTHYEWFKEGLLTKEGQKPRDFDKKYHAFMKRKSAGKAA
jgi:hypothetical protein